MTVGWHSSDRWPAQCHMLPQGGSAGLWLCFSHCLVQRFVVGTGAKARELARAHGGRGGWRPVCPGSRCGVWPAGPSGAGSSSALGGGCRLSVAGEAQLGSVCAVRLLSLRLGLRPEPAGRGAAPGALCACSLACGLLLAIMSEFLYIPVAVFTFLFLKSVCVLTCPLQYPYRYICCVPYEMLGSGKSNQPTHRLLTVSTSAFD